MLHTRTPDAPTPQLKPLTLRELPMSRAEEALRIWRDLDVQLNNTSVACSPTWAECWLNVYSSVVPARFLVAERDHRPVGITLVANGSRTVGPIRIRTAHLGTAGEPQPGSVCVEYNRPLVDPDDAQDFLFAVCRELHSDPCWDELHLDGFSERELADWLRHFPGATIRARESKYFNLAAARESGSDILARLGSSTRSNIRRRLKKYGQLDCQWAESVDDAADIFEELVQLHQQRWQSAGEPGAFASERFLEFQRQISVRLFLEKRVVLFRVRHAGATVGCLLLLVDNNRLLDYLSGLASFEDKPSPGLITHYQCMTAALDRGFAAYDFLVGDKQHKDNLSDSANLLCWLTWSRPRLKLRALDWLRAMKRRLRPNTPHPAPEATP